MKETHKYVVRQNEQILNNGNMLTMDLNPKSE